MNALGVIGRGILFIARHPLTKRAFHATIAAGLSELVRHAQRHIALHRSKSGLK